MKIWKKAGMLVLACAAGLTFSGCMKAEMGTTIHADGTVTDTQMMMGVPLLQEGIMKEKEKPQPPNTTFKNVSEGNMSGYEKTTEYPDLKSLVSTKTAFAQYKGKNEGIRQRNGWLYDYYTFDMYIEGQGNNKTTRNEEKAIMDAVANQISVKYTLNLPYEYDATNAEEISKDKKTLTWNIWSALMGQDSRHLTADFKVWHKPALYGAIIVAVIALGSGAFLIVTSGKKLGDEQVKFKRMGLMALSAFVIIGGFTGYTAAVPPTLNESDLISTQLDETKNLLEENNPMSAGKKSDPVMPSSIPAPAKPAASGNRIAYNSPDPDGLFRYYHQSITNHELRSAYNCYSDSFKSSLNYDSWAAGYDTTLKSIPQKVSILSNDGSRAVLTYRLKAVDRDGDSTKTQYFTGQCTLVKADGLWKIDEITAKRA